MKAIFGLGNIGNGYKNTYHNIGFMLVDMIAKRVKAKFDVEKCKSLIAKCEYAGEEFLLVKPATYMNRSGLAVDEVMRKFKIKSKDIIIVADDIDLPVGRARFRLSGSSGTHNGLRNIVEVLKREDFSRIRVGVGRDENMRLDEYVLSNIDPHKREEINQTLEKVAGFILDIISNPNKVLENVTISN